MRSDRLLFLGSEHRQAASDLPVLRHAELLLRSLGATLEDNGFAGFGSSTASSTGTAGTAMCVPEETQLAVYGAGAFYRPHRDGYQPKLTDGPHTWLRLRSVNRRVATGILYLNDNGADSARPWRDEDGGCLRVYLDSTCSDPCEQHFVDIPPIGGRLVVFDSQTILHEVRPTFRERAAITVWFLSR